MSSEILVSISCTTFNHAAYIRECLDGFLKQKCNFAFEVLIHDDASNDGTQEIIKEYQEKFPDIIKPYIQSENQWSQGVRGMNVKYNFSRAKGKYIAMCEGDDYWTDPLKLQKQVDALESHPEFNICSHPSVKLINGEISNKESGYWGDKIRFFTFEEVLMNFARTAPMQSIMIRNKITREFTKLTSMALGGHSMIQIYFSYDKGLIYLPDEMAVYRINSSSSVSKGLLQTKKTYYPNQLKNIKALEYFKSISDAAYAEIFDKRININYLNMIRSGLLSKKETLQIIKEKRFYRNPITLVKSILIGLSQK